MQLQCSHIGVSEEIEPIYLADHLSQLLGHLYVGIDVSALNHLLSEAEGGAEELSEIEGHVQTAVRGGLTELLAACLMGLEHLVTDIASSELDAVSSRLWAHRRGI